MVGLDVPDCRFYGCPVAEQLVFLPAPVVGIRLLLRPRYQYRHPNGLLNPPVPAVTCSLLRQPSRVPLYLGQCRTDGLAVMLLAEGHRTDDKPALRPGYRGLVAELVLLVLLALTDAFHLRLVNGVYLVFRVASLGKDAT